MAVRLVEAVVDWANIVEAMDDDRPAQKLGPYKKAAK
jgi:hypothetical protein